MSDSYIPDESYVPMSGGSGGPASDLPDTVEKTRTRTNGLGISAAAFANAITKAFSQATTGAKQFDDVVKSLALRLSSLTVAAAFKPFAKSLAKGLGDIFKDIFGDSSGSGGGSRTAKTPPWDPGNPIFYAAGGVKPFASGGVIGTPTYFPLSSGGLGLAGEAGPEAIVPLSRGPGGQLGIAMNGGGAPANISVQIATPDAGSFRRSEAYITGQIARAVARGQRSF